MTRASSIVDSAWLSATTNKLKEVFQNVYKDTVANVLQLNYMENYSSMPFNYYIIKGTKNISKRIIQV